MKLRPTGKHSVTQALALFTQIGVSLAVIFTASILAGKWLDSKLGTAPIFSLVLILAGLAAAAYCAYRLITKMMK